MAIAVRLSTTLRSFVPDYNPTLGLSLDFRGETTANDLAQSLNLPLTEIKIVIVNGRRVDLKTLIQDGDRVAFFPAVGGGLSS
ncbi:MAG: MoaD/ThiS family protein [Deltaproteobacteria bacterium]|jgi:molybdopterin converting factor small subunit|nr:MoaD/ThiS family protein [Deltaproteobacteria bacterium]